MVLVPLYKKKRILLTSGPGQVKVKKKKQPETKEYQYSRLARTLCPAPSFWTWPPSKILKVQPGQNDKFMTLSCFDPFPNLYLEKCGVEQKAEWNKTTSERRNSTCPSQLMNEAQIKSSTNFARQSGSAKSNRARRSEWNDGNFTWNYWFFFVCVNQVFYNKSDQVRYPSLTQFIHSSMVFHSARKKKKGEKRELLFFFPGPWRGSDLLINCVIRAVFCVGHYQWSNLLDLFFFACCFAETVLGNLFD